MSSHDHGAASLEEVDRLVAEELAQADQRYTRGRRSLVALLAAAGRPLTMPEILELGDALPQSSVYRNLDVLEQLGLVRKVAVAGAEHARYELSEPLLGHHHHLICVLCGLVTDVHFDDEFERQVDATLEAEAAKVGFRPLHHSLDLNGFCADCDSA